MNLVYSQRNRSAACRIPLYSKSPKAKRVEFRCPDPSANPYLAFSRHAAWPASTASATGSSRPTPSTRTSTTCRPSSSPPCPRCPVRSTQVLRALVHDHDYLLAGDVFTPDLIETWIDHKRKVEIDGLRLRPHPYEFQLYYDI